MIRKRKIITFILAFMTFIISSFACSFSIVNSNSFLRSFSINDVSNISTLFTISFDKVNAANEYEVIIYEANNEIFYNKKFNSNVVNVDLDNIKFNQTYKIVVFAYDENGNSISVNNPYVFTYSEPTFSEDNSLVLDNFNDYTLLIDGDITKKNYEIGLYNNDYLIYKESLNSNEFIINQKYFNNISEVFTVKLLDGDNIINSINLFSNMSPVSNLKINNPITDSILDYSDVSLDFSGGDNASSYILEIYKDNRLIKTAELNDKKAVISSEFFEKDNSYKILVKALYNGYDSYTKEDSVSFKMNEKDTLLPVYINTDFNNVKVNSKVLLTNPNSDGVIYYTLDGTVPDENSFIYEDGIIVNNNVTINAIVKSPKKNDSVVSKFNVNINNDKEYKVYLSPSNQTGNLGVSSTGFTNESKEMNDVTDFIEKRLKGYGVRVYRNSPSGNINLWVADSKYLNCDLHFAIHSNASVMHTSKGVETWINEQTSSTYSLANIIQNDLMNIYPDKENGNRGVKYSNGALGETRMPNFGILVEVAYHDYEEDAYWIMNNKELIGNTLADSILKYFGIIS